MALFVCAFSFLFPPPCRFVLVFVRFSGYCFIRFWFWFSLSVLVLVSGFGLSSIGAGFGFLFWYPGFWVPIEVFCVVFCSGQYILVAHDWVLGAHRKFFALLFLFWVIYFGCTHKRNGTEWYGTEQGPTKGVAISPLCGCFLGCGMFSLCLHGLLFVSLPLSICFLVFWAFWLWLYTFVVLL